MCVWWRGGGRVGLAGDRCPASRVSGQGLGSGAQSCLGCRTAGCGHLALAPRGHWGVRLDATGARELL